MLQLFLAIEVITTFFFSFLLFTKLSKSVSIAIQLNYQKFSQIFFNFDFVTQIFVCVLSVITSIVLNI